VGRKPTLLYARNRPEAVVLTSTACRPNYSLVCPYEDLMTLISNFVEQHQEIFAGAVRSTPEALHLVEKSLNVKLRNDMIWFLTSCGVANTEAVSNERAVISNTMRYREAIGLPNYFVVLDDRNDGGTVFLDTSSELGAVAWVDSHAVYAFAVGTIKPTEYDAYPSFFEWVAHCITVIED